MFKSCTSLTQVPALPATTLANNCYNSMFYNCTSLKLSSTQTEEYTQEYRIPSSGTGTTATDALIRMFINTGGTFAGTPAINTTYYLSTDNMIVRDTEVTTLNGYVGSMIDVASVQPDWNQNDEAAADYVKNRPFYTATSETVLVEESTASFANPSGNIYVAQIESNFEATVGGTYKVSWDGTTYESTCVDIDGYLYVGNLSIAGVGSDTGEPFLIFVSNDSGIEIYTLDASASHTISVSKFAVEVVKIDKKYLPDTVVQPDWNQNDDTKPDYVKNRPFYTTTAEAELVNREFAFVYNSAIGFYANAGTITIELTEGKTYKVMLDGVEYETVCQVLQSGMLYIGAPEFINGGTPPSDMPFVCAYNTSNGSVVFATITGGSHFIIVKEVFAQIVKIPEQYIPEMSSVTLLSSTTDSTKKFKITVDDSGAITATEVT